MLGVEKSTSGVSSIPPASLFYYFSPRLCLNWNLRCLFFSYFLSGLTFFFFLTSLSSPLFTSPLFSSPYVPPFPPPLSINIYQRQLLVDLLTSSSTSFLLSSLLIHSSPSHRFSRPFFKSNGVQRSSGSVSL